MRSLLTHRLSSNPQHLRRTRTILGQPALGKIERLDIRGNPLTQAGWRALEKRFGDALVGREAINRAYDAGRAPLGR